MDALALHLAVWMGRALVPTEMMAVAATPKRHFANMSTYVKMPLANATCESISSKIRKHETRMNAYHIKSRFADATLFPLR